MASPESRISNAVEDPHWKWPAYDVFEEDHEKVDGRAQAGSNDDPVSPFHVTYMRAMGRAWPEVRVVLFSQALIDIVRELLPENANLKSKEPPAVSVEDLYGVLHLLVRLKTRLMRSDVGDNVMGLIHLKHLVRFMEFDYANKPVRIERMTKEKRASFDMLNFFIRGLVIYTCHVTKETVGAQVKSTHYRHTPNGWMLLIMLRVFEFNGRHYGPCLINRKIHTYAGDRPFSDLPVYPIEMADNPKAMLRKLLLGGRMFRDLMMNSNNRLIQYSGALFRGLMGIGGWSVSKEYVDGRVMIDLESFRRMNPEYPMGNANPILEALDYGHGIFAACRPVVPVDVPDELLMMAPAIVYGFSLTAKKWGCFAVRYFTKVVFDRSAVESLGMDPATKCIVRALVSGYMVGGSSPHAIPAGLGCVFLCCGGVRKTLTATSVAETLGRPLWAMSSEGMGSTPDELRDSLLKILYVGARWGAVLLFQGADVYLDDGSVGPNSLADVFLRTVTLYPSVLFLSTTHLPDDAYWVSIGSGSVPKISLIVSYHRKKLTVNERKQIWADLLGQVGVMGPAEDFVNEAAVAWNLTIDGIRGAVCLAQLSAQSHGVDLNVHHVRHQLPVVSRWKPEDDLPLSECLAV